MKIGTAATHDNRPRRGGPGWDPATTRFPGVFSFVPVPYQIPGGLDFARRHGAFELCELFCRPNAALPGGEGEPQPGAHPVAPDPEPAAVPLAQIHLRHRIAVAGRPAVPPDRLCQVHPPPLAEAVHAGDRGLRHGIARLGEGVPFGERGGIVAAVIGLGAGGEIGVDRGGCEGGGHGAKEWQNQPLHGLALFSSASIRLEISSCCGVPGFNSARRRRQCTSAPAVSSACMRTMPAYHSALG